jgi:hypothetical protein
MPVGNAEATVGSAVWSILDQTITSWELLAVADRSQDATVDARVEDVCGGPCRGDVDGGPECDRGRSYPDSPAYREGGWAHSRADSGAQSRKVRHVSRRPRRPLAALSARPVIPIRQYDGSDLRLASERLDPPIYAPTFLDGGTSLGGESVGRTGADGGVGASWTRKRSEMPTTSRTRFCRPAKTVGRQLLGNLTRNSDSSPLGPGRRDGLSLHQEWGYWRAGIDVSYCSW